MRGRKVSKPPPPPGTVIDLEKYTAELDEVRRLIEAPRCKDLLGPAVVRVRVTVPSQAVRGVRGGRIAVAAGQYLVWYFHGRPVPRCAEKGYSASPFYDVFGLYWSLLRRKLDLDADAAADLVRLDMAGRGDSEPRHALVKLLERNFAPPAPDPLNDVLRRWGDELAVHPRANYRKLATRVFALADESA